MGQRGRPRKKRRNIGNRYDSARRALEDAIEDSVETESSRVATQRSAPCDISTCDWCESSLSEQTRYHCGDCAFELCATYVINAPLLYPNHDRRHICEEIPPSQGSNPGRTEGRDEEHVNGSTRSILLCALQCNHTRDSIRISRLR